MLLMLFIMYEISDGNYFLTGSHFYKTICPIIFSHLSSAKNECLLLTSCQRNMLSRIESFFCAFCLVCTQ